jgi:hypothetical protein
MEECHTVENRGVVAIDRTSSNSKCYVEVEMSQACHRANESKQGLSFGGSRLAPLFRHQGPFQMTSAIFSMVDRSATEKGGDEGRFDDGARYKERRSMG